MKYSAVYIFDEAASTIDVESESDIMHIIYYLDKFTSNLDSLNESIAFAFTASGTGL